MSASSTLLLNNASLSSAPSNLWIRQHQNTTEPPDKSLGVGADDSQPVTGMNVFWIIFILGITSAWHPLGASVGFPSSIRRYVRILPFVALFDTLLLYSELVSCVVKHKMSVRASARMSSIKRLRAALPDTDGMLQVENGESAVSANLGTQWLQATILFIGLDLRVRLISNALVILAYAKMFGYSGTPVSFAIATVQFGSWVANESFLLFTYGLLWARNTRHLVDTVNRQVPTTPRRGLTGFPSIVSSCNIFLFYGQVSGFIAMGILTVAPRIPDPGVWGVIVWTYDKPLNWYDNAILTPSIGTMVEVPGDSVVLCILWYPVVLVFAMLLALPFSFLAVFIVSFWSGIALFLMFWTSKLIFFGLSGFHTWTRYIGLNFSLGSTIWRARCWSFLLLVSLLVYYLCFWDSAGTSKAPWTENLG